MVPYWFRSSQDRVHLYELCTVASGIRPLRAIPQQLISCVLYFPCTRNASVHARAALASVAAGFVHFFPRTP